MNRQTNIAAMALREALQRDEIISYFQPIVALRTGQLVGFEVLARWPQPDGCMIPPAEFIPLAEEIGVISELTDSVVFGACIAAADWPRDITLSVNVSPLLLHDRALPKRLCDITERTGFPLSRIVLEITESALIENPEVGRGIIVELKALGAQIAQDDFGTGYSSLRQLQSLPFDRLKVDASFVASMADQRASRKIVAAVIGLGLSLGMSTVAEGVETQRQADMLVALGCDLGQGWWFGPAVPAAEAASGLKDGRWNRNAVEPTACIASAIALRLESSPSQRLAQLQALYDGAPVGLALLDNKFQFISLNRRLAEMHGSPVAALVGRALEVVEPFLFRMVRTHLHRVLLGETVADLRVRWTPADMPGEERMYVMSYHPVRDEADEIAGISVAIIDVTDRQRGERLNSRLPRPRRLMHPK
jgi:PAS domain S-box-containing protein